MGDPHLYSSNDRQKPSPKDLGHKTSPQYDPVKNQTMNDLIL